jgi:hypothetical protein
MLAVFSSGNAERAANPHKQRAAKPHDSSGGAVNVSSGKLGDERSSSTQKKRSDSEKENSDNDKRKRNSQRSFVCWVVVTICDSRVVTITELVTFWRNRCLKTEFSVDIAWQWSTSSSRLRAAHGFCNREAQHTPLF